MFLRSIVSAAAIAVAISPTTLFAAEAKDGSFQSSDGLKIHYIQAGRETATGSPVVLIHGYTGNARGNWFTNGVAEALAKKHWVVAIDCRGHGDSDKPHDADKYAGTMHVTSSS